MNVPTTYQRVGLKMVSNTKNPITVNNAVGATTLALNSVPNNHVI